MLDTSAGDQNENNEDRKVVLDEKINAIGSRISTLATTVEGKRTGLENRWYDDLRQVYGKYDEPTAAKLKLAKKSQLFIKATRPKCETWKAKLTDLLFPTDDKNWGMRATPVAELEGVIDQEPNEEDIEKASEDANARMAQGESPANFQVDINRLNDSMDKADAARDYQKQADVAAEGMARECEDQLVEAKYAIAARDVIDDGVEIGTGILKGPFDSGKVTKKWQKRQDGKGNVSWIKVDDKGDMPKPSFCRVDYWSFFPDPNATCIEDAEYTFERHILTAKDLRRWARKDGFDKDVISEILEDDSKDTVPTYLTKLRAITLDSSITIENKYIIWEYRGPLQADEMAMLYENDNDTDGMDYAKGLNPLDEVSAVVYVCAGKVINFGISAFDSEENIYSVFNLVKDPTSIFGWGIPWLMADSQRAQNAAWRMMMDNGGLAAGPQIVVDKSAIQPANGDWSLTGRKIWHWSGTKAAHKGTKPFEVFEISSNQTEFSNIITMARDFSDDETNLPSIVTGDLSANSKTTYGGTAILDNNANIIFRKAVGRFDDNITVTALGRLFDWNMQFNPKEEIKGDIRIDARGSSVLLVREIQSQNLMIMLDRYAKNEQIAPIMKIAETFRKTVQSMSLNPDDHVMSDSEIDEKQKADEKRLAQEQEAGRSDPEAIKLEIANINAESRIEAENIRMETALIRLASDEDMQIGELKDRLGLERDRLDLDREKLNIERDGIKSRERTQAAEIAIKDRWNKDKNAAGNKADMSTGTSLEG